MKTYETIKAPAIHEFYQALSVQLPSRFNQKIAKGTNLNLIETGYSIEIWLPAPYEHYLYKIEVAGNRVNISKSEHYTDDVNSLAMEDVLTDIVLAVIGKDNVVDVVPSSNQ